MTETPKEKIEELIEYYKKYEDSPQTEKCLQELLAYKETVTGIAECWALLSTISQIRMQNY